MIRFCLVFFSLFFLVFHSNSEEIIQTEDYIGDMDSFDRDSGTRINSGQYQTGHKNNPGTYDKDFDLESQMTISDINAGFDLDYGVTVNSHSSNARLNTCTSITQNSDCRDIFKLTITLFDSNEQVHLFEHEVELDFSGNRDYTYNQVIQPNDYQSLTGNFELYGVDAGYPSGWYGPKFSDPFLTTSWQVVDIINQEILDLIEHSDILDTVEFDTVDVVIENPQGEIMDTMTIEVEQNMDMAMEMDMNMDIAEIEIQELPEISTDIQESPVEIEIETQMENELETEMSNSIPEPEREEIANVEESSMERETEQNSSGEEESVSDEGANEVGSNTEAQQDDEQDGGESGTSGSKKERVVQTAKQKVANKIVKNMGDKGRYDETNQLKTLVVMQVLGNTKTFFDVQSTLQDTENFFDTTTVPDNTISDSNYAQYIMFGGSDAAHSALVDSQY